MKPYVCCHFISWEISARTRHLWGNKVWQSGSKTSTKSVKLYTGGFILIHRCCRELISLSLPSSSSLAFSVCACVPRCLCMRVCFYCKKHKFYKHQPKATKHIQSIMLRFIVLWGVTGCKAVSVIKSDRRVPSQTRMPSSPSHTQPSLSSEQLRHILNLSRPAFLHYFHNDL